MSGTARAELPLAPETEPWPWRRLWPVALAMAVLLGFYLLFPGTVPFIADEPEMVNLAIEDNAMHRLATHALVGSTGRLYGPGAIWFYQAFLLLTHDLVTMVMLRVGVVFALMAGSLLWLAREARLWAWGALAMLCAPPVWFYTRMLWDNAFLFAFGALAMAAYASFLRTGRGPPLFLAMTAAAYAALVHLMAVPMALAFTAHLLLRRRAELRRRWKAAVIGAQVIGIMYGAYLVRFLTYTHPVTHQPQAWRHWYFALFGPRAFSAVGLDRFFYTPAERTPAAPVMFYPAGYLHGHGAWSAALSACAAVSAVAYPLFWAGLVFLAGKLFARRLPRRDVRAELGLLAFIAVALQVLCFGAFRLSGGISYYSGSIVAQFVVLWFALDGLARLRVGRALAGAYVASLLAACVLLLSRLVATTGTTGDGFGVPIGEQVRVARELQRYSPDSPVDLRVPLSTEGLVCLRVLSPEPAGPRPRRRLTIRYADPSDPYSAKLEVVAEPLP